MKPIKVQFNVLYLLAFLAGVLLCSPVSQAAGNKVRIATYSVPPQVIQGPNGEALGIIPDLMAHALEGHDVELVYEFVPFPRGLTGVTSGTYDLMVPVLKTADRAAVLDYPENALYPLPFVMFSKAGSAFRFDGSIESIYGASIARMRRSAVGDFLENAADDGQISFKEVTDFETMFKVTGAGRTHFAATNLFAGLYYRDKLGLSETIMINGPTLSTREIYYVAHKFDARPDYLDVLARRLEEMRADGTMDSIRRKWLPGVDF